MELNNLRELYIEQLLDLYDAEAQILGALPEIAKASYAPELRAAFQSHYDQTRLQAERLETILYALGGQFEPKGCMAMRGILEEGKEVLRSQGDYHVRDAAIIAAAQRVEHYEIAAYGTAHSFAVRLGEQAAAALLEQSLNEEQATDELLSQLAEQYINREAAVNEV